MEKCSTILDKLQKDAEGLINIQDRVNEVHGDLKFEVEDAIVSTDIHQAVQEQNEEMISELKEFCAQEIKA